MTVFPSPGGGSNSVKLVQVDKVKTKRILAEVAVHASVDEVRPSKHIGQCSLHGGAMQQLQGLGPPLQCAPMHAGVGGPNRL